MFTTTKNALTFFLLICLTGLLGCSNNSNGGSESADTSIHNPDAATGIRVDGTAVDPTILDTATQK